MCVHLLCLLSCFISCNRKEVYLPYRHVDWVPGCQPHPGNIVEPASLAVIESVLSADGEDISESLPTETIKSGKLSSLQLESVLKAVSRVNRLAEFVGYR